MKLWKNGLYACLALGMLIYAAPRLSIGGGMSAEAVSGAAWICFCLLVIAANLHELLGVDRKERERIRQVERVRSYRRERKLKGIE